MDTLASIIFSYLRMHRHTNNGSSFFFFCRPPFSKGERKSILFAAAVPARLDFMNTEREGGRGAGGGGGSGASFALKSLGSGSRSAPHLYLTPSLAPSLLFPPFKRLPPPRLNVFLFCRLHYTPLFLSRLFFSCRLPPTSKSLPHSRTCPRYLKTGGRTQGNM